MTLNRSKSRRRFPTALPAMLSLTLFAFVGCTSQSADPAPATQPATRPATQPAQAYKVISKPLVLPTVPPQPANLPAPSSASAAANTPPQSSRSGPAGSSGASSGSGQSSSGGGASTSSQPKSSVGGTGVGGQATLGAGSGAENQRVMQVRPSAVQGLNANLPSADAPDQPPAGTPNVGLLAQLPQAEPQSVGSPADNAPADRSASEPRPESKSEPRSSHDAGPGRPSEPEKKNLADEIKSQLLGVTVPTPTLNTPPATTTPIDPTNKPAMTLLGTWVQTAGPNDPDFSDGGYVSRKLTFTSGGGLLISSVYDNKTQIASVRRFRWTVDKPGTVRVDTVTSTPTDSGKDPTNVQVNVAGAAVKPANMKLPAELNFRLEGDTLHFAGKEFKKAP